MRVVVEVYDDVEGKDSEPSESLEWQLGSNGAQPFMSYLEGRGQTVGDCIMEGLKLQYERAIRVNPPQSVQDAAAALEAAKEEAAGSVRTEKAREGRLPRTP